MTLDKGGDYRMMFNNGDVVQFTKGINLKGCIGVVMKTKMNIDGAVYTIGFRSPINDVVYYKVINENEDMITFIGKSKVRR